MLLVVITVVPTLAQKAESEDSDKEQYGANYIESRRESCH